MIDSLRRDVVIRACAISAGIHGALAPSHFGVGAAAGGSFVVAAAVLAALAVALTRRPEDGRLVLGAALILGGLIVAYGAAVTTGLPLVHPHAEPIDGLALVTKAFEASGLVAAATLLGRPVALVPQTKGL